MKRVAINGFGRIGRCFTRIALLNNKIEIVAVNDLADIKTLAHLLKYDSVHGKFSLDFTIVNNELHFENGKKISFIQEKDPEKYNWKNFNIDVVLESTGIFLSKDKASFHIKAGAKKVLLSAPSTDKDIKTIVYGVNHKEIKSDDLIISNASCTTNSAAPMVKVLKELCEIETGILTTVHSFTSDQRLHDAPHKDLRRARAATLSIVPSTTGAAKALWKIFPEFSGKLDGTSMRVPVPDGSITDFTFYVKNPPTLEEINLKFKEASANEFKDIIEYSEDNLVSSDIVGNPNSLIFDAGLTCVLGNMVKIVGWYDNEYGYSSRLNDVINLL